MEPEQNNGSAGPIIASVIIILVIIVGGFYFWNSLPKPEPVENKTEKQVEAPVVNPNSVESVEAELEEINFDELDVELEAIEAEFDQI